MTLLTMLFLDACAPPAPVPRILEDLETRAEDTYRRALDKAQTELGRDAAAVRQAWDQFRERAKIDGAGDFLLQAIDKLVTKLEAEASKPQMELSIARIANAITQYLDELYSLYETTSPPALLNLGYGGREVTLDALEEDPDAAQADLANLNASWWGVRNEVLAAGGVTEVAAYEASLERQARLLSAEDLAGLREESDAGLQIAAAMKDVFGG
jgi:hypothetical protein